MNIDKNIRTSAATAVIIAASTSLAGNIIVANADSVNKTGVVNTSTLNVRKGPGTNNAILTKIHKNDKVKEQIMLYLQRYIRMTKLL